MMDLSLNVARGGATTTGSVLRGNQAYIELLSGKHTLDGGIAFSCARLPDYRAGQQFREVWVETAGDAAVAFAAAEQRFAEQGVRCARWALAEAQPSEIVEPVLHEHGFRREDTLAMALAAWPDAPGDSGIRVLPARPMRAAYETCWSAATGHLPASERSAAVQAATVRLDDHRMDAFVAMQGGKPAGIGALFQVGDIGLLVDFFVLTEHRRSRVGTALLQHAIALARRLSMRIVCTEVSTANAKGVAFLAHHGFVEGGRIVEFHRGDVVRPDYESW